MRKILVLPLALGLVAACHNKVKQEPTVARPADPGVNVDVLSNGTIVLKSGVLVAPLKVVNRRDRFIQVFLDRCELETAAGDRRHRRNGGSASTVLIAPGKSETFKLIFGDDKRDPLPGDTFRVWVWAEVTDGSGVIAGVPPLVFGAGSFQRPPQGFANTTAAPTTLPPPTEPPPPAVAPPPPGTEMTNCSTCGEPRPKNAATCPHCGLP